MIVNRIIVPTQILTINYGEEEHGGWGGEREKWGGKVGEPMEYSHHPLVHLLILGIPFLKELEIF